MHYQHMHDELRTVSILSYSFATDTPRQKNHYLNSKTIHSTFWHWHCCDCSTCTRAENSQQQRITILHWHTCSTSIILTACDFAQATAFAKSLHHTHTCVKMKSYFYMSQISRQTCNKKNVNAVGRWRLSGGQGEHELCRLWGMVEGVVMQGGG